MFGQSSTTPFGKPASTFGGFGQQNQQPSSLFGAAPSTPAFGQQQPQQSTPLFGGGLNTQTSSFGTPSTGLFGAKPASTPLFGGGATSTPAFSSFGQSTPSTTFSFGAAAPSNPFGQPQQQQASTGFGGFGSQPANTSNEPPDDFTNDQGVNIVPIPTNGTTVPFTLQQRGDAPQKRLANGNVDPKTDNQHTWYSIASQREYWNISPEELRWQDYQQNRKQGTAPPPTNSFSFGGATNTTATPSVFGTPQNTNAFGASSTPSVFGGAAQNTGTGLFGAKPASPFGSSAAPAFGAAPASTSFGFGSTPAAAPATPFGATNTAFGTNTSSSPFGGSTAAPVTGLFGQPAATPQSTFGGGFGATPNKFSFGSTPAQPASTSLFGQPASTPAPAFGAPAPAANNPFSFGQPQATPAFGAPAAGQQQQQPQATTSLFGGNNAFGAASKPLFGAGASTANPFGSTPAPATNQFSFGKPATPAQPASTGLFGSFGAQPAAPAQPAQPFAGFGGANSTGLFGSLGAPAQTGLQQSYQQPPPPSTNDSPYGNSAQFAPSASPPKAPFYTPVEQAPKIKPAITAPIRSALKSTPAANRLRFNDNASPALNRLGSPKVNGRQSPALSGGGNFSPNAFMARPSVKRLELDRKSVSEDLRSRQSAIDGASPKISFNPELESATPRKALTFNSNVRNSAPKAIAPATRSPTIDNTEELFELGDYSCNPPVSQLNRYNAADLASVPNFSVTHKGHGSVRWLQPVDLTQVGQLSAIPGRYIRINGSNLLFYDGEEEELPDVGQGLNTSAIVTLEASWPIDKATGKAAQTDDKNRLAKHTAKLKRLCSQMGGQFVDFDTATGAWTFKLPNFAMGRAA